MRLIEVAGGEKSVQKKSFRECEEGGRLIAGQKKRLQKQAPRLDERER